MEDLQKLPLRLGVGIVLLNHENKVFVGKRIDNPNNFWQMPKGGVDRNEELLDAAKRELEEETSIKSVKFLGEVNGWLQYNLPQNLLGKENEINIKTKKPEFSHWKWISSSELPKVVVDFKVNIYQIIADQIQLNYKQSL